MNKNILRQLIKEELQIHILLEEKIPNQKYSNLLNQLMKMAEDSEIDLDDIKGVQYQLMQARRKGQQSKNELKPDFQSNKARGIEKRKQGNQSSKERNKLSDEIASKFDIPSDTLFKIQLFPHLFWEKHESTQGEIWTKVKNANKYWDKNIYPKLQEKYPLINSLDLRFIPDSKIHGLGD